MPIKHSAQKALRQTHTRTLLNRTAKVKIKKLEIKFQREIAQKQKSEAAASLVKLTKLLDKAAKKNIIAPNAASRRKSRLQKTINKIG